MERPMATSERKRGYWQLKTENRRVYIVEQKKEKKNTTPISAVVTNKKGFMIFKFTDGNKICGCD